MSYIYRLTSHTDIGYNKFFDTFREEYDELWYSSDEENVLYEFINTKLIKYNARVGGSDYPLGTLIFDSDVDFTFFIMRWM